MNVERRLENHGRQESWPGVNEPSTVCRWKVGGPASLRWDSGGTMLTGPPAASVSAIPHHQRACPTRDLTVGVENLQSAVVALLEVDALSL